MSYANGTQFYNLPQTVGTDKRDWFDTNGAFAAVDAALHAAATGQAADAEAISTINTSLAAAESDIAALQTASTTQASDISALQATVATQGTAITDVRQDAEDMISAFNEGAASVSTHAYAIGDYFIYNDVLYKATAAIAIGDTIVPNTNCSATNVTSEIKVINADIDDVKSDLADVEAALSSITIDHTGKTIGQLLKSLYDSIDRTKLSARSVVKLGTNVFVATSIQDSVVSFTNVAINENNVRTITLICTSNASTCYEQVYAGATSTYSTYQSEAATDDVTLYY